MEERRKYERIKGRRVGKRKEEARLGLGPGWIHTRKQEQLTSKCKQGGRLRGGTS